MRSPHENLAFVKLPKWEFDQTQQNIDPSSAKPLLFVRFPRGPTQFHFTIKQKVKPARFDLLLNCKMKWGGGLISAPGSENAKPVSSLNFGQDKLT